MVTELNQVNRIIYPGIKGVEILPLNIIPTQGGPVLKMLNRDSPLYSGFGEVYFSEIEAGKIKAWKRHKKQTQHFAVPTGKIKLVLYGPNMADSLELVELFLGRPENYNLLKIPPHVWYGFQCVSHECALICNLADLPHDPAESEKADWQGSDIPYNW